MPLFKIAPLYHLSFVLFEMLFLIFNSLQLFLNVLQMGPVNSAISFCCHSLTPTFTPKVFVCFFTCYLVSVHMRPASNFKPPAITAIVTFCVNDLTVQMRFLAFFGCASKLCLLHISCPVLSFKKKSAITKVCLSVIML